jgi:hypothetical protein
MLIFAMPSACPAALAAVPLLISLAGGAVNAKEFGPKIPRQVLDWKASGEDAVYDRKTLYGYMDGGAEVYLAFDFRDVFVRKYAGPSGDELVLDIYDMGSSAEAFGVFSCDRQDPGAGLGQGSEYGPGLLRFWRGRYFVSVTVAGNEEKAEAAVLALGRAVAPLLGPDGPLPDMLGGLPADGLKADRTSYFHDHVHLSNRYYISSENVLNLGERTACVFAEYDDGRGHAAKLLLVRYPGAAEAEAAGRSFRAAFLRGAEAEGTARTERKGWVSLRAGGALLAAVFEASSKEYAERLAAAAVPGSVPKR